jgi:hypothetical protein
LSSCAATRTVSDKAIDAVVMNIVAAVMLVSWHP